MRVKIHRGTKEIGGSCIEVEAQGKRILLDLGLPLDRKSDDQSIYPKIDGLTGDEDLLALILSHGHQDHWGLAHLAGKNLPVALGSATLRIFKAAEPFLPTPYVPFKTVEYSSGKSFTFGPFTITPHLVDHSGYDAYALEVQADGRKLFYSGDFRAHGRKASLFERMIANPPKDVDVLLMEGSTLGRLNADHKFPAEADIEDKLVDIFNDTKGMALVATSAQNIDRMVSMYRACKRTGRTLIIDLYAAEILRATENKSIPQSDWPQMAVYIPQYQRIRIKKDERFDLLEPHKKNRIYKEDMKAMAHKTVYLFRPAMLQDLDKADCLNDAVAIWSQWDGYLKQETGIKTAARLAERNIPLVHAHTSGHASIVDLKRFAKAINPKSIVPIHTFEAKDFPKLFGDQVQLKNDGDWWDV
ncbi:MAG: MBL fold metallo-hydrolase [Hyphomicrobiales bacterium]